MSFENVKFFANSLLENISFMSMILSSALSVIKYLNLTFLCILMGFLVVFKRSTLNVGSFFGLR